MTMMPTGAAMRRLLLLLGALACLLPPAGAAATLAATLTIDRSSAPMPVLSPGRLFGSFFEDFLHAAGGGIYAGKLANRALAQPLANASTGMICTGGQGTGPCTWSVESGTAARDASAPLSAAVPHGLWLSAGSVVSNSGFPGGIAVSAGESLSLSLFVLVRSGPVSLEARIVDTATGGMLGSASLLASAPAGVAWRAVKVPLTALRASGARGCRLQLRATGGDAAKVGVTVVSLFPTQTWKGRKNGLRTDVAAWLNESQPAFIRMPGGCYVEGQDLASGAWYWKKTLGPIQDRPGHMNDVWGYWTDDGLGEKNVLFEPFIYKNDHFTKTGSGQT